MKFNKQLLTIYLIGDKKSEVRVTIMQDGSKSVTTSCISSNLNDQYFKSFIDYGLKSIKFKNNEDNNIEIIEMINLQGDSLTIHTDNLEERFNSLFEYLNSNKIELFRKSLNYIFLNNKIEEIMFEPSNNCKDCEIYTTIDCGKIKLVYSIPYKIKDNKKNYDHAQLEFIKEIIENYLLNNNSEIASSLDIGRYRYLEKFYIHSNNGLNATICSNELCESLMNYIYSIKDLIDKNYIKLLKK